MTVSLSTSFKLPLPLKVEEEEVVLKTTTVEKQGIVSILGSDCQEPKVTSLRRTLSADMSSRKWSVQNGFSSTMKKIASHEKLAILDAADNLSPTEEYELDRPSQSEVWRAIQADRKPAQGDNMWNSILSQKSDGLSSLPPPYIHPLVKRSASSLSEKSLEICTESLGSETGCDGFSLGSSPPASEICSDVEDEKEQATQLQNVDEEKNLQSFDGEETVLPKYNYCCKKASTSFSYTRSFPPPIPSRSRGEGQPSVKMQSFRRNGRLVVEAVSVSPINSFHAERHDGRLLLTLINNPEEEVGSNQEEMDQKLVRMSGIFFQNQKRRGSVVEETEEEEKQDPIWEEEEEEEEEKGKGMIVKGNQKREMRFFMDQEAPNLTSEMINMHTSALMMKNIMTIDNNRNANWSHNRRNTVSLMEIGAEEDEEEKIQPQASGLVQLISSSPRLSAATSAGSTTGATSANSFNAYEYFWRARSVMASLVNPIISARDKGNHQNMYEQQELVLMRGNNGGYFVPMLRGCKEPRRSLLIWEPCCIATS